MSNAPTPSGMRTARDWCNEIAEPATLLPPWRSNEQLIKSIQADAARAAREEMRERCAKRVEDESRRHSGTGLGFSQDFEIAADLRALPVTP